MQLRRHYSHTHLINPRVPGTPSASHEQLNVVIRQQYAVHEVIPIK